MSEVIIKDGIPYTKSNKRMRYNPEFCENHGEPYTDDDLIYICSVSEGMKKGDIAMAVGKTHGSVLNKLYLLKHQYFNKEKEITMFDYYKGVADGKYEQIDLKRRYRSDLPNNGKAYKTEELIYMCFHYDKLLKDEIAIILDKTQVGIRGKTWKLKHEYFDEEKKITMFDYYRELGEEKYGKEKDKDNDSDTINKVS